MILTGSFLKKTNDVRVSINHRFFHDFQPIPTKKESIDEFLYHNIDRKQELPKYNKNNNLITILRKNKDCEATTTITMILNLVNTGGGIWTLTFGRYEKWATFENLQNSNVLEINPVKRL